MHSMEREDIVYFNTINHREIIYSMMISDLKYLEPISEKTVILGGTVAAVFVAGVADGDFINSNAYTTSFVKRLPNGGSIAVGIGYVSAQVYDSVDASAAVGVQGSADGQFTTVITQTHVVDTGRVAVGHGTAVVVAITP